MFYAEQLNQRNQGKVLRWIALFLAIGRVLKELLEILYKV